MSNFDGLTAGQYAAVMTALDHLDACEDVIETMEKAFAGSYEYGDRSPAALMAQALRSASSKVRMARQEVDRFGRSTGMPIE